MSYCVWPRQFVLGTFLGSFYSYDPCDALNDPGSVRGFGFGHRQSRPERNDEDEQLRYWLGSSYISHGTAI